MQLNALLARYLETNQRVRSPETVRLLRVCVRHFADFLQREPLATDLTDEAITGYSDSRRRDGLALATVDGEVSKLVAIQRFAATLGLTSRPMAKRPTLPTSVPVALLRWQIRALWKAAGRSQDRIGRVPGSVYWPALLDVIWDTGERIGAIYQLQRSDFDFTTRWVTIRHRKGNGQVMVKRLRRATIRGVQRLAEHRKADELFAPICLPSIYRQYTHLLRDAGLPTDRRSKFHCLRRSHASYLHVAGGDSRASLGHSSDAVTIKHYLDPRIVAAQQPADLLFSPLRWWERVWGWMR